jgi:quinol monooxygenase YgiN
MLIVQVDFQTAPKDHALTLATLRAERPVVTALPGNLGYTILTHPGTEGKMTLIHHWADAETLAAYRASDGLKAVGAVLFPLMVGKPETRVYDAHILPAAA